MVFVCSKGAGTWAEGVLYLMKFLDSFENVLPYAEIGASLQQ